MLASFLDRNAAVGPAKVLADFNRWLLKVHKFICFLINRGLFSTPVSGVCSEPSALIVESAGLRLSNKVPTSMRIPNCFRGLYYLHLSTHPLSPLLWSWLWLDQMSGLEPYSSPILDHGGNAIWWVSRANPAPDIETVHWIKSASNVTKKGDLDMLKMTTSSVMDIGVLHFV